MIIQLLTILQLPQKFSPLIKRIHYLSICGWVVSVVSGVDIILLSSIVENLLIQCALLDNQIRISTRYSNSLRRETSTNSFWLLSQSFHSSKITLTIVDTTRLLATSLNNVMQTTQNVLLAQCLRMFNKIILSWLVSRQVLETYGEVKVKWKQSRKYLIWHTN